MSLKGGFGKASKICTNAALVHHKVSELAKKGYQTEHFFEGQMVKKLLETAIMGALPNINVGGIGVTPVLKAALLAEDKLLAGWNKVYPATAKLNNFLRTLNGKVE
ncbi:hypothetical protein C2857_003934 [Epichloe festucae Fl1]|uniref:Uncharacterized protein n=1 Tax=Epichloe festucae (strain Fl1) TaxID=877507 RepID=A0A7S9PSE3_EPIFF|nr:hypothetical protein C2857_003934 [Epichloe festucae Fl1]